MTVEKLIDLLKQQDPQAEVMLATQPNWPQAFNVGGVTVVEGNEFVWIVEGSQHESPYAPKAAWEDSWA